ncbi:hypothetical protein THAOC_33638, partial [Thalassiosira oceanica]
GRDPSSTAGRTGQWLREALATATGLAYRGRHGRLARLCGDRGSAHSSAGAAAVKLGGVTIDRPINQVRRSQQYRSRAGSWASQGEIGGRRRRTHKRRRRVTLIRLIRVGLINTMSNMAAADLADSAARNLELRLMASGHERPEGHVCYPWPRA